MMQKEIRLKGACVESKITDTETLKTHCLWGDHSYFSIL